MRKRKRKIMYVCYILFYDELDIQFVTSSEAVAKRWVARGSNDRSPPVRCYEGAPVRKPAVKKPKRYPSPSPGAGE